MENRESSTAKARLLFVANTSWYLYNFRLSLAKYLRAKGLEIIMVAPHDEFTSCLVDEGFRVVDWNVVRSSVNPVSELRALILLTGIYRRLEPELVHHFTIKACLYGTVAAKLAHVYRVANAVTGLGHVFVARRKRNRIFRILLSPLFRSIFKAKRSTVVFQNEDDLNKFSDLGFTSTKKSLVIRGSGVDIRYFSVPEPSRVDQKRAMRILFPSRLIKEKGTVELVQAVEELWEEGEEFEFYIAGDIDEGNRSSLGSDFLCRLSENRRIKLLGHVTDMKDLYRKVDVVVLPSWREGLSKALIEAAAMRKAIITTDVPGCKDVVETGVSGILVPTRNSVAIKHAIKMLLRRDELVRIFGNHARWKVEDEFQDEIIHEQTELMYINLLERSR